MKTIVRLLLLATILFSCSSHEEEKNPLTFTGLAMTIPYRILVGSPVLENHRNEVEQIIAQTFAEIDETYNKWNPLSELSQLNSAKAKEKIYLSKEMNEFLQRVKTIVVMTEGRYDPTIECIQTVWRKYLPLHQEPPHEELAAILPALGWHNVHIDNGLFYKDNDATQLDLSGIAKGYAVDLLIERLSAAGYPNTFVEWGGEVRAQGLHPKDRPWNIYISRFEDADPTHAIAYISLTNQAIATSGDYNQNWRVGKTRYCHIYNPKSGRPYPITDTSIASASVVAKNCFLADALATAALTFSNLTQAQVWADSVTKNHPDVAIWLMARTTEIPSKAHTLAKEPQVNQETL